MKDAFIKHKKKIIIAILTIGACFFPPVAKFIPGVELIVPNDSQERTIEQK